MAVLVSYNLSLMILLILGTNLVIFMLMRERNVIYLINQYIFLIAQEIKIKQFQQYKSLKTFFQHRPKMKVL